KNGSMNAVSGCGRTSMSDSLIATQPRIEEPSKPRPSSKVLSLIASEGMVKCCHRPGKSMKRRSTALTSFSRMRARTSLGVTEGTSWRRVPGPGAVTGGELPESPAGNGACYREGGAPDYRDNGKASRLAPKAPLLSAAAAP